MRHQERARGLRVLVTGALVGTWLATGTSVSSAEGRSVDPAWERSNARIASAVSVGDERSIAVLGYRLVDEGDAVRRSMVLRVFDSDGTLRWTRAWLPDHGIVAPADVAVGSDGSVVVAGHLTTERALDEAQGAFLRRYSSSGALLWARTSRGWRAGEVFEVATGVAVGSGSVVVSGQDYGCCGDSYSDGFVRAYGLDGTLLWENPFEPPGLRRTHDGALGVAIARSGAVYAVGWVAMGPESLGHMADHEILVQRISPDGERVWSRILRHPGPTNPETAVAVAVDERGASVAGAWGGDWSGGYGHAWLARFTRSGRLRWAERWGREASRLATATSVAEGLENTVLVTGTRRDPKTGGSDVFLRGYSMTGKALWRLRIERPARFLHGTDVSANDQLACVAGYKQRPRDEHPARGWVWCFER